MMKGPDIFQNEEAAAWARAYTYQIIGSLFDHFEDRMEHPPYTILCVGRPGAPREQVDAAVTNFFLEPWHCLSLCCRRIRTRYPTADTLKASGKCVLNALGAGCAMQGPMGKTFPKQLVQLKGPI